MTVIYRVDDVADEQRRHQALQYALRRARQTASAVQASALGELSADRRGTLGAAHARLVDLQADLERLLR